MLLHRNCDLIFQKKNVRKTLRDRYRKERRLQNKEWCWRRRGRCYSSTLSFLDPFFKNRQTSGNIVEDYVVLHLTTQTASNSNEETQVSQLSQCPSVSKQLNTPAQPSCSSSTLTLLSRRSDLQQAAENFWNSETSILSAMFKTNNYC